MKMNLKNGIALAVLVIICLAFIPRSKPTLYLVGDSTVRNGRGEGDGGLWGWGNFLPNFIDTTQLSVQNKALGGTSSRSYWSGGYWGKVESNIKPGDVVLIQFGHNDGNPTTLKGISDDSTEVLNPYTKKMVMAHTFGWNIRKYVRETRARGGVPVVVSLIPRNIWKEGKVNRIASPYADWSREVAQQENAGFIDLHNIVSDHYDEMGEQKVKASFFNEKDYVHTIEAGARFNAASVVEGLKSLKENPLRKYLKK